jgi:predicted aconitase
MDIQSSIGLSDVESAMLEGELGEAPRLAMSILARVAPLYGADRFIEVTKAHIDGCIYEGEAGLAFAESLAEAGGRVRVPTSLNVISLDRARWQALGQDERFAARARRPGAAYLQMGAQPTFTCAPYQTDAAPAFGEQIAWSESNAVAYANSIIGARTNRYGDYLDISCAITGRAPASGLHLGENRLGSHLIVLDDLPFGLEERTDFYAVLGYLLGRVCPDGIPVVEGLTRTPDDDQLKALCAAAATSGAIAMLHLVGITPEAATIRDAFDGRQPVTVTWAGMTELKHVRELLTTARSDELDVVAFGSPHCSLAECQELAGLMSGNHAADGVQVFVTTSSAVRAIDAQTGVLAELERFGASVTADTCIAVAPLVRPGSRALMTNSAKYAHYGPGLIGVESVFGTTADCVHSAIAGRVIVEDGPWA